MAGLDFIAVAYKTVHFATASIAMHKHGSRFRRRCVHSKLVYTYVCTLFTSFPCYIEFYVEMEEMEDLDKLVAPNDRYNQFKYSMCNIFCIVRNMLSPQYLFRLSFIFSVTAPPGEGPPPPAGSLPAADPPPAAGPPPPAPAAANGRHVYAELHSHTTCVQVLRLQDFPSSCPAAPPFLPPPPPSPPTLGEGGGTGEGECKVREARQL